MRKIVLNGIIGIVLACYIILAGCSDANSINEKFFIGDWRCTVESFEKHNSSRDEDYGKIKEKTEFYVSFKMIDGKLNMIAPFGTKPVSYLDDLTNENVNESIVIVGNIKRKVRETITKINDTQFRFITEMEINNINNTTNLIKSRYKLIFNYTKMK